MSFIKKIEQDYNNGVISRTEVDIKRSEYNSLTKEEQNKLDIKHGSKNKLSIKKDVNLNFEDRILNILDKQSKILIEQHKLLKRISNNVLFFFWITIISLFILPIIWIIFGLSILL